MIKVEISEAGFQVIGELRIALSAETVEDRLKAMEHVQHRFIRSLVENAHSKFGAEWEKIPSMSALAAKVSKSYVQSASTEDIFSDVFHQYEKKNHRGLMVAEQVGQMVFFSIVDRKLEGLHRDGKIIDQVCQQGRARDVPGAKDKDTVRKSWMKYKGVVHLGMALNDAEELKITRAKDVLGMAEEMRLMLCSNCPKGTSEPYVNQDDQISFVYKSGP
ncbi:hypothetical protein IV417_12485 [Alphaproteobacteria bacterium KMM 3653]|uniref:Uncharacterized protein n=1 Tax=Harenicola maris TaxID=2841044 RepID=A0AAP2CPI3_9RHOB|nr:hypothetical protein [Harenicola maris]